MPAPPLTWAFALPSRKTFQDRAKSVPNPSALKPLTSAFVIRVSPIVIAYILMLAQSSSFAEASGLIPTAGSVYDYVAAGMGRFFAITGTLAAYLIVHVFAGTAETASAGLFAAASFDFLDGLATRWSWTIGVGLLAIFAVVNFFGVELYGRLEVAMTGFMWVTLFIFGVLGTLQARSVELNGFFGEGLIGPDPDFETILSMVGLAFFLFVGVEFVTPLASELKNPSKAVPRAMYIGVAMVAAALNSRRRSAP